MSEERSIYRFLRIKHIAQPQCLGRFFVPVSGVVCSTALKYEPIVRNASLDLFVNGIVQAFALVYRQRVLDSEHLFPSYTHD